MDQDDDIFEIYGGKLPVKIQARPIKQEENLKTPDGRSNVQKGPRRATGTPKGIYSSPAVYTPVALSESGNYGSRTGKGDVILRYNCSDSSGWTWTDGGDAWSIGLYNTAGSVPVDCKFMFQKTRDMAITMNQLVHHLSMCIIDENDLEGYQSLKDSTTEEAVFVGRIRGDGLGKLTAGSIFLEGTLESSNGHTVTLDLSSLEEYFLFAGQVVAVGGTNNLGKCVVVNSMFFPRPLPFPEMPLKIDRNTGPLNILVASGPFTSPDSLSFEALSDLSKKIKETKPNICFLIGPFLDESHPKIDEFIEKEDTFEKFFRNKIQELCNLGVPTKFILVSSSKDIHHLPVYPTPAYNISNDEDSEIRIDQNIVTAVPDPATISVNGVVIGITATDVLFHMQKNVLSHATIHTDRFSRTAREMLSQRSYYPLYPPNESVPLDVGLWAKYAQMDVTPHIMILPSDLNYFIKDVDKTVVLNPGRLSSGKRTYARLHIDVPSPSSGSQNSLADFIMGEIVKI